MKNIEETRNYFVKERDQKERMSKKHKKGSTTLNCTKHFLTLASMVTGCISVFAFASLLGTSVRIVSSAIGLKICAGIKKQRSLNF